KVLKSPIEVLFLGFVACTPLCPALRASDAIATVLTATALHFVTDGPRWQLSSAYGAAALIGVRGALPGIPRLVTAILGPLCVFLTLAICYMVPFVLPLKPRGPYSVATVVQH
ncbi:unnamed protein product, partial [Phaeothamnion confervicola]